MLVAAVARALALGVLLVGLVMESSPRVAGGSCDRARAIVIRSVALPDSVAEPLLRTVTDLDAVIAGRAPSVAGGAARASAQL